MCGIAGILSGGRGKTDLHKIAFDMAGALNHRGPDAQGAWSDEAGIAMGHTRLAIIDLSEDGLQPMTSQSQRYTICFNGEIYNFRELISYLESKKISMRGYSDTEAFLECIDCFGLQWTLEKSRGMFAFSLWDAKHRQLKLCRDRLGEKPLYYGMIGNDLVFASELKSFKKHPQFQLDVNRRALSAYTKYSYVPTPMCILDGFKKLPPASIISGNTGQDIFQCEPDKYWDVNSVWEKPEKGLEEILVDVIRMQMVSDVPVGCFLSGGIDSSLIAALMQSQSDGPIDTFTIGFNEREYDESRHAAAVANHIGSNHHEWIITPAEVMEMVPRVGHIYDEPFGDSSSLPTTLLAEMTRQSVKVCLSGDGGDELFYGYKRYILAQKVNFWRELSPSWVKKLIVKALSSKSEAEMDRILSRLSKWTPINVRNPVKRVQNLKDIFRANDPEHLYDKVISHWNYPEHLVVGGEKISLVDGFFKESFSFQDNMTLHDINYYLSDDIMVKVDRATMANSLESRAPLLDHRLVEFSRSVSIADKTRNGQTKAPLRELLYKFVPRELIERPKMGFGVPLGPWLRGDLKEWAGDLLAPSALKKQGYFHSPPIETCWEQHQSGRDMRHALWDILAFQQWLAEWQS